MLVSNTVCRILKDMGFSLRVNSKTVESGIRNPPDREKRDHQFNHIKDLREKFAQKGYPAISVDTKKKELIGNFKNNGKAWQQKATEVFDHDFPTDAVGKAVPYGIYDTQNNTGTVFVGCSADTPSFAVECIETWWKNYGKKQYPDSKELLIMADAGGSNGYRSRVWKFQIQRKICDQYGLSIVVCHYPPGSSKWNPIEHRLFSEISKNWAGRPLDLVSNRFKIFENDKDFNWFESQRSFCSKKIQKRRANFE